ncbi:Leucine rich repeat N-terminal domain [Seminavis robusta]|uniref:Leucine rich repeat N-terminal domain n=1 Tax=Seminavis robusta TaxID=568900 RepID=A0A9N8DPP0_9STRA|nr:Leucine rich repeat N-terminal domain [Seminavis robusta]|eukprot:Sro197_g083890.1 Leucine rich repeat N-terminal domain (597) ;mRNA; r:81235-83025
MSTSTTPRSRTWPAASNSNGTASSDPKRNASDTISKLLSGTSTCLLAQVPQPDDEAAADAFDQEISQCQPNLLDLISVAVTDNTTITSGGSPEQDKPEPPKEEEQPVEEEQVEKKKDTWVTFTADFPTEHYLPVPPPPPPEEQAEQAEDKGGEDHNNNNIEVEIQDHFEELGLPQDKKSSSDRQGLFVYLHHKSKRFVSRLSGWSDATPREYQHQPQEGDDELDTQDNHNHKSALHARQVCLCILCLAILAAIVVPVVVCNLYDKCGSNNSNNDINNSNQSQEQPQDNDSILMTIETTTTDTPGSTTTTAPPRDNDDVTSLPPIDVMPATHGNIYDFVTINLGRTGATMEIPEYTVRQLDDHRSPQSKAYLWLAFSSSYPADVLQDMPLWRTQQLFALATLFFSLQQQNPDPSTNNQWLNASLSECQWSTDLVCYPALPHNQGLLVNTELDQVIRDIRLDGWHHNNNNNNNSSTSVLPAELELLKGLQHLQVTNTNAATGSLDDFLPTVQLANLPRLHTLVLHNNHLTGGIPSELGALTGLRQLELDRNELSGRVPDEICKLTTQNEQELFLVVDCTGTTSAALICPENDCNCNCS